MVVPADEMIRFAVAHDLTHVAQDEYFNAVTARYSGWFVEMMASYVGFRYWEDQKRPLKELQSTFLSREKREARQLRPMDTFGNQVNYPYYVFPRWLDRNYGKGSGLRFLLAASESWLGNVVDLEDLSAASRRFLRRGVGLEFLEYFLPNSPWITTTTKLMWYCRSPRTGDSWFPEVHDFNKRRAVVSGRKAT